MNLIEIPVFIKGDPLNGTSLVSINPSLVAFIDNGQVPGTIVGTSKSCGVVFIHAMPSPLISPLSREELHKLIRGHLQ